MHVKNNDTTIGCFSLPVPHKFSCEAKKENTCSCGKFQRSFFLRIFLSIHAFQDEYMQLFRTVLKWIYMTPTKCFSMFS